MSAKKPLAEFWRFTVDFQSAIAWIAKAAVAAPLADLVLNIGPPWPSRWGVSALVCIAELVVLMWSFEFWQKKLETISTIRRVMKWAVVCLVASFLIYLYLFAAHVFELPDMWHRDVGGFRYHDSISGLIESDPAKYTDSELLERFSRNPEKIWTRSSIIQARVLLCVVWLILWVSLSSIIAAFVALQWRGIGKLKPEANTV